MRLSFIKNMSMKTKMAIAVTALFTVFVITASYFILSYFEDQFKATISAQQFSLVSSLADTVDDKLAIAQNALIAVAAAVPHDAITNVDVAQRFLDSKTGLLSIFDNGIFLINRDGRLIVESPYRAGRRGRDISFREWFKETVTTRKPYVSSPYISTHTPGRPAVVLTVPMFDKYGVMTGMITGSLDLFGGNFLAELSRVKIGKTGYLFMVDMNRTLLIHPDKKRVMGPAAPPGANRLVDRAFQGFEGSGETITSYGVPMLTSIKHLRMATWFLGANYPKSEAYAPLYKADHYFLTTTVAATVIFLLMTWFIMKRLMSPLTAVTRHVKNLPEKSGQERMVPIDSTDEIGVLATVFNTMVNTLDSQQESLKENEEKFRLLADFTSDWEYWIDPQLQVVYSSPSCQEITGYSVEEFRNAPLLLRNIVHPDDRDSLVFHLDTVHHGKVGDEHDKKEMEFRIITKDGNIRWIGHVCRPIFGKDGTYRGRRSTNRDITERKLAVEALHEKTVLLEREMAERQIAQEALSAQQKQLEALNNSLEERIVAAIRELRQKDQILIQQSRQAAMGEMINNIAHQWRQPLNNLGLIVQNMQYSFELGRLSIEGMRDESGMAMKTISYMSRTIDDFRNFFRQDKEKQGFDVNGTVSRVLDFVSSSLRNSDITVDLDILDSVEAVGYPNEYSQVLLNILNNARDALMERNVPEPRIKIRMFSENDLAVVTIQDNGGGIADDILPRIFDPYFSTKEPGKGTGIGLYMSKTIIEQNMGGKLTARNISGGAEFRIELLRC